MIAPELPRLYWPLVGVLAVLVYLHSLDGLYIPHIGDEAPYVEIARLTAESSRWLPLKTAPGLENTKPPLLFWIGIAATNWGESWTLWRLRAPIVLFTFATAFVVFWLARRSGVDRETSFLGALTFLGFYSSFQYGRPFLTNSPETLFVFSSFAVVVALREGLPRFVLSGVLLGMACLFKSFALVVPVGLALAWLLAWERGFDLRGVIRHDAPRVALVVALGLAGFSLWPLLDPEPGEVLRHFVLEENVGKLSGEGYIGGLFRGPYALQWLWLGSFANAGLFVLPLAYVVVASLRERSRLSREEKALWILVLSFLIVYSIPSQRQENYLLPIVPALALLIAMRWKTIPARAFRWFSLPGIAFAGALLHVVLLMRRGVIPAELASFGQVALPVLVLALWSAVALRPRLGPSSFHALVFSSFFLIAVAVAPFEGPLGRFEPDRVEFLEGRRVYVPTEFISRHERHRFLLPGARVEGYDPADVDAASRLLESGALVVVHRPPGEEITGPFRVVARRYDLRSRQTKTEMLRILTGELDLLVRQELVIRRHRLDRMIGEP